MPLSPPAKTALLIGAASAAALGVAVVLGRRKSAAASPPASCPIEQPPQPFLIRSNYLKDPAMFQRGVQYRTEQYGYFPGFGSPSMNAHPPSYYAVDTTFMGLPVKMNRKVVPILKCVEDTIRQECGAGYQPKALSGLRLANTYHGYEVSNHVYGIAIDIDPKLNPCCGCIGHWSQDPLCAKPDTGPYSRMTMPECWVHVFERFGFYWLGHDPQLRDQMHFEWLGDPTRSF